MAEENKGLIEKIDEIYNALSKKGMKKELKLGRGKVKGAKMRKGWVGVLKVDENGLITPTKVQIEGSVFDFNQETYHATNGSEILFWKGKFPIIIQPSWKRNPLMIKKDTELNQTYGDKYVLAKLHKDLIKLKRKSGGLMIILIIAAAVFVLGKFVFKWF